ncbi:MAG: hypothetical protein WBB69_11170 [Anaerolineales bacterium]
MFEIAIAGAIIRQGLLIHSLRRLTIAVVIGFILLFVVTIMMQSFGLTPSLSLG